MGPWEFQGTNLGFLGKVTGNIPGLHGSARQGRPRVEERLEAQSIPSGPEG